MSTFSRVIISSILPSILSTGGVFYGVFGFDLKPPYEQYLALFGLILSVLFLSTIAVVLHFSIVADRIIRRGYKYIYWYITGLALMVGIASYYLIPDKDVENNDRLLMSFFIAIYGLLIFVQLDYLYKREQKKFNQ